MIFIKISFVKLDLFFFFINNYQFSVDTVAGGSGDQSIRVPTRDRETHGRPDRNTKGT